MHNVILSAPLASCLIASAAFAQPAASCYPRAALIDLLMTSYNEEPFGAGVQTEHQIIEIWASEAGITWTIIASRSDGQSCVMAYGTDWQKAAQAPRGTVN